MTQRAEAIQDLIRQGYEYVQIMRIENALSKQGLDRVQSGQVLAEIVVANKRSADKVFASGPVARKTRWPLASD